MTARLRVDLKAAISGDAPALSMTIPAGLSGVAYDSKVWDRWSQVSAAVAKTESLGSFIARAESLEASYKAILLVSLIKDNGNNLFEFPVSEDSSEAKIEEGDSCTVGIVSWPGFPLLTATRLILGSRPEALLYTDVIVSLSRSDRQIRQGRLTADGELSAKWYGVETQFNAVMAKGVLPIGKEPCTCSKTPLSMIPKT